MEQSLTELSIKVVLEQEVSRLRERAKANHRSLQRELRALIDETSLPCRVRCQSTGSQQK
jgi:hypothetical protein